MCGITDENDRLREEVALLNSNNAHLRAVIDKLTQKLEKSERDKAVRTDMLTEAAEILQGIYDCIEVKA